MRLAERLVRLYTVVDSNVLGILVYMLSASRDSRRKVAKYPTHGLQNYRSWVDCSLLAFHYISHQNVNGVALDFTEMWTAVNLDIRCWQYGFISPLHC